MYFAIKRPMVLAVKAVAMDVIIKLNILYLSNVSWLIIFAFTINDANSKGIERESCHAIGAYSKSSALTVKIKIKRVIVSPKSLVAKETCIEDLPAKFFSFILLPLQ